VRDSLQRHLGVWNVRSFPVVLVHPRQNDSLGRLEIRRDGGRRLSGDGEYERDGNAASQKHHVGTSPYYVLLETKRQSELQVALGR